MDIEKLGLFYLGRHVDPASGETTATPLLYDASDLVTHAVILGMTGSGKTGLGTALIEEAAIDGVPALVVDPKGDMANLLLTFPDLELSSFAPWVSHDEARLQGISVDELAAREAARWRDGLAEWGQGPDRIARLRASAEFGVYTPGSRAARPLSVLRTFAPPTAAIAADPELLAERASTAATSVLVLAGIDAEPLRSREHILVSTLLGDAWQQQRPMDLPTLIAQVQSPPLQRIGVLELDAFYPPADRFALSMALNRLLAAPDFAVWLEGDPLDIDALLYAADARPRVTVLSIAHLDDRERMFFVSLLLNELVSWMRQQRGTSTLRALVYIDEMTGFLPPVATPASKKPLLTLLKQARAFGIGVTLATQNPVDLDYKALSNAGTWFLGRLQTERDKARVLDGLEGANAVSGHGFDRAEIDRRLSGLAKRTFLLHNVHEPAPVLFTTRWTLSYLRGPMGREELGRLANASASPERSSHASRTHEPDAPHVSSRSVPDARPSTGDAASIAPAAAAVAPPIAPVLHPSIPQFFAPGTGTRWTPALLGAARVSYSDTRHGVDEVRDLIVMTPLRDGAVVVDWAHAEPAGVGLSELLREPPFAAAFDPLPPAAASPKSYERWARDFGQWIARSQPIELWRSPRTRLVSATGESERDFRIRVQTRMRELRDEEMTKVRDRFAPKLAALEDRVRRAEAAVQREEQQASASKMQAGVSVAATLLGALLGRRKLSTGTLGRATTAARGMSRVGRETQDVERAKAQLHALQQRQAAMAQALQAELHAAANRWNAQDEPLERVLVKPKRGGVGVQLVALLWTPRP